MGLGLPGNQGFSEGVQSLPRENGDKNRGGGVPGTPPLIRLKHISI